MSEREPVIARGRSLLGELLRMTQTRLEMLAIELEQEKLRIARALRLAAVAAVCAWLAGFTLVLWAALSLRPPVRFIVLGTLFVLFVLAGLTSWIALRRSLKRDPPFSRLIGQLRLDRASLGQEP
ncbi:MAG: phage holin family protein [Steroidobacteraceae bacterium]